MCSKISKHFHIETLPPYISAYVFNANKELWAHSLRWEAKERMIHVCDPLPVQYETVAFRLIMMHGLRAEIFPLKRAHAKMRQSPTSCIW